VTQWETKASRAEGKYEDFDDVVGELTPTTPFAMAIMEAENAEDVAYYLVANTLLTIDMITREALRLAHEKATFIGTINRQFDDSFGDAGAKIGDTLRIRYPVAVHPPHRLRVMDVQDGVQLSTALTVATQDGVDMRSTAVSWRSIWTSSRSPPRAGDGDLISNIDSDVLQGCTKSTYNFAGTAGTAVSSLTAPGQAAHA
jgi:hypothetical protein